MNITGTASSTPVWAQSSTGQAGSFRDLKSKVDSAVADKLGIGVDQLQAQLKTGKSLSDIASSAGVSRSDLLSTITSALQAAGTGTATATASSTSGSTTTGTTGQGADLSALANRIADHVGGRHHHHGGAPGAAPTSGADGATTSAVTSAATTALANATLLLGADTDGTDNASTQAALSAGSLNVQL